MTRNVYVDFDGVITPYNYEDYIHQNWIHNPRILCKEPIISALPEEYIILTKVSTEKERRIKRRYIQKLFPNNKVLTTKKAKHKRVDPVGSILIDDYNINLEEWRDAGGIPVKFINNINSPRPDMTCLFFHDLGDRFELRDNEGIYSIVCTKKEVM